MAEDKQEGTGGISSMHWRYAATILVVTLVLYLWNVYFMPSTPQTYPLNYTQFMEQLNANNIKSVSIKKLQVRGEFIKDAPILFPDEKKPLNVKYFETILPSFQGEGLIGRLQEKNVVITVEPAETSMLWQVVLSILPWVLIIGLWVFWMRRSQQIQGGPGGLFSFGASKAKLFDVKKPGITFKDVAGMDNVKVELRLMWRWTKSKCHK